MHVSKKSLITILSIPTIIAVLLFTTSLPDMSSDETLDKGADLMIDVATPWYYPFILIFKDNPWVIVIGIVLIVLGIRFRIIK